MANDKKKTASKAKSPLQKKLARFSKLPHSKGKYTYQSTGIAIGRAAGMGLGYGIAMHGPTWHSTGLAPVDKVINERINSHIGMSVPGVTAHIGAKVGEKFKRSKLAKVDTMTSDQILKQYSERQKVAVPAAAILGAVALPKFASHPIVASRLNYLPNGLRSTKSLVALGALGGAFAAQRAMSSLNMHHITAGRRNHLISSIKNHNKPTTIDKVSGVVSNAVMGGGLGALAATGASGLLQDYRMSKGLLTPSMLTGSKAALGGGALGAAFLLGAVYKHPHIIKDPKTTKRGK